jgi:phenylacetate-coenzyme A ligase PaaK-like adenylate-forming protein
MRRPEEFAKTVPVTTLEGLVSARMKSGDPYSFSSPRTKKKPPKVAVQLEYDTEVPLYTALDANELSIYADALRRCWSLLGIAKGDRVAIFDYGTSPLSYLAASAFTPYLTRGASDLLGCVPICNDGVASMCPRAVEILRRARPRIFFIRNDCLHPLAAEIERQAVRLSDYTHCLVASDNETLLTKDEQKAFEHRLGVPIYRLLRIDAAMLLAIECSACHLLHSWRDLYFVETLPDGPEGVADSRENSLVITNWFAKTSPRVRYLSHVRGSLEPSACSRGRKDLRIVA